MEKILNKKIKELIDLNNQLNSIKVDDTFEWVSETTKNISNVAKNIKGINTYIMPTFMKKVFMSSEMTKDIIAIMHNINEYKNQLVKVDGALNNFIKNADRCSLNETFAFVKEQIAMFYKQIASEEFNCVYEAIEFSEFIGA